MPIITPEYNLYNWSDLNFPTIEPSLKLDFANARALDPRITFERASTATYVGRDGLVKYAADDEARFDHDPTTAESLGLLIEESRTNLLKGTSNFASGYWTIGGNRSAQGSNQLAPDGTLSAFSNAYNGTSGDANIYYSDAGNNAGGEVPTSNNTVYTLSVFAKVPSGNNYIQGIFVRTYNSNNSAIFNLKTGTIVGTNEGTTTNRIEAYPNGWYRCSITFTSGTDGNQGVQFYLTNEFNATALNDPSANGEALYYWAPQLEAGAFPTSYIPTSGSTATRSSDNTYITGTNFTEWYNATEWTMFSYARSLNPSFAWIFHANDNGRRYGLSAQSPPNGDFFERTQNYGAPGGLGDITHPTGTDYISGFVKAACCMGSSANAYTNGSEGTVADAFENYPLPATELAIGFRGTYLVNSHMNGHIKQLAYYPKRLTNTQLQTLTQ